MTHEPTALRVGVVGLVALFVGSASTGCSHHIYSPPARVLPLESVAPVGAGKTGVQLEGSTHEALFGVDAIAGTARVRYGATEDLDVSGEANVVHIGGDSVAGTSPNVYSARVGTKLRVLPMLAVQGGVGAGTSAGGEFIAPDVGVIAAYENKYIVPFVAGRAMLSVPIGADPVDTSTDEDPVGTHVGTPQQTRGLAWNAGLKVPLPLGDEDPWGSVLGGVGQTYLVDDEEDDTVTGWGLGAELVF